MPIYAFTVTVTGLDLDNETQLAKLHTDEFIVLPGQNDDLSTVSIEIVATSGQDALAIATRHMATVPGLVVSRVDDDLVNIAEIALRLGVTAQAARNYAAHRRATTTAFPAPRAIHTSGLKLWTWAAVYEWATAARKIDANEPRPLSESLVDSFNGQLGAIAHHVPPALAVI